MFLYPCCIIWNFLHFYNKVKFYTPILNILLGEETFTLWSHLCSKTYGIKGPNLDLALKNYWIGVMLLIGYTFTCAIYVSNSALIVQRDYVHMSLCTGNTICTPSQFRCSSGQCIPASSRCDGYITCINATDEINCSKFWEIREVQKNMSLLSYYIPEHI